MRIDDMTGRDKHERVVAPWFFLVMIGGIVLYPTYIGGISIFASQKILFFATSALCGLYVSFAIIWGRVSFYSVSMACIFAAFSMLMIFHFIFLSKNYDDIESLNSFRHLSYLIFSVSGYIASRQAVVAGRVGMRSFWIFMSVIFLFEACFMLFQLFSPSNEIVMAYSKHHLLRFLGARLGGTFNWTYIMCIFLIFVSTLSLYRFFRSGSFFGIMIFAFSVIAILMTQSRTGLFSAIIIHSYLFVVFKVREIKLRNMYVYVLGIACTFGTFAVSFVFLELEYIKSTLSWEALEKGFDGIRYVARINQIALISEMKGAEWFLGSPEAHYVTIENAYAHYVFKYGIPGIALYLSLLTLMFVHSFRAARYAQRHHLGEVGDVVIATHAMVASLFLFGMSSSPIDAHKISPFIFLIYGFAIGLVARQGWAVNRPRIHEEPRDFELQVSHA